MPETATKPGFDPNIINFAGVEVSAPHLSALMSNLYYLDRDAYPFLTPALRAQFKPTMRFSDGYVERNSKRERLEWVLPRVAPAAGEILMSLDSDHTPQLTPDQAGLAKEGILPWLAPGDIQTLLSTASNEEVASALTFVARSGLPFGLSLDTVDRFARQKVGPTLDKVKPHAHILTAGEQPGVRQEFQQEVKGFLDIAQDTARARAANRERQSATAESDRAKARLEKRLQENPDRYLSREDTAAGIGAGIQTILTDKNAAPMLHGLAQSILASTGKSGKDISLSIKALEVGADLIVDSLLKVLPEDEQRAYHGLYFAANSTSAVSFWARAAIKASVFVPKGVLREQIMTRLNMSPAAADILAKRGRHIYNALEQRLPRTLQALNGTLPTTDKRLVATVYEKLQRRFGTQQRVGSSALHGVAQATA